MKTLPLYQLFVRVYESSFCPTCGGCGIFDDHVDTDFGPNTAQIYQCEQCERWFYVGQIWKPIGNPYRYHEACRWQNILAYRFRDETFKIERLFASEAL